MSGLHNLKPERIVRAFERAGWKNEGQKGSHVKLTKKGNPNILSISVHKGKPVKNRYWDTIRGLHHPAYRASYPSIPGAFQSSSKLFSRARVSAA